MQAARFTLPKSARLRHRTLVDALYASGEKAYEFPLRAVWRVLPQAELDASFKTGAPQGIGPVQVMVTVPKKRRRHAVDRVLLRRRIREAWRLNRAPLLEAVAADPSARTLQVALVYVSDTNADYAKIERKLKRIIARIEAAVKAMAREGAVLPANAPEAESPAEGGTA